MSIFAILYVDYFSDSHGQYYRIIKYDDYCKIKGNAILSRWIIYYDYVQ